MSEHRLTGRPAHVLGASIVVLEFAAAFSTFVSQTLLPVIVDEFASPTQLGVLVSGSTIGLFVAMPLAGWLSSRLGPQRILLLGMLGTVFGGCLSAMASNPWTFAAGRFAAGFAGGLLGVFGISAAIKHLEDGIRKVVIAWSSAMWILPGLVAPALIVALEHLIGWRWTLLTPLPMIIAARVLIVRAVPAQVSASANRPDLRTLLVPTGVLGFLVTGISVVGWACLAVAAVGFAALMPHGATGARRGAPAGLLAMTLFATGYFGAGSMITLLFTTAYRSTLAQAGIALGGAAVAWAVASLALTRCDRAGVTIPPGGALAVTAIAVATLGSLGAIGAPFIVGALLWGVAGAGVGLFYPTVYLRATTPADGLPAEVLATAAISAEAFGALLGSALGGAIIGTGAHLSADGFITGFLLLAAALALAAGVAARSKAV